MKNPFALLSPGLRLVLAYYLASPLFWLLDSWFGWQFRLVFLEDSGWKSLYYSLLLTCALAGYLLPGWMAVIALLESTVSIAIHLLSFMLPIFTLSDAVLQGRTSAPPFTLDHIISFLLAGLVMTLSFRAAIARLQR